MALKGTRIVGIHDLSCLTDFPRTAVDRPFDPQVVTPASAIACVVFTEQDNARLREWAVVRPADEKESAEGECNLPGAR
jgi:hypothetical protein